MNDLLIAVVGPCTSGKTTLARALRERGFSVRTPTQEHSKLPGLWQQFHQPDVLIYLDVTYDAASARRRLGWGPETLAEQTERLSHARQHADLYLQTANLTPTEVLEEALAFLEGLTQSSA